MPVASPPLAAPVRVVVGTAGHIDHGKTELVRALTGIDCDRLPEEKARGITIDIGFANLTIDDLQLGFIDVPGHEHFVKNMLAGVGGIDIALLVVAADESVKPQTREHLAICELLAIPGGLVALTKCDLVDADIVELARLEVEDLCRGTFLAGAPIVPVSARTGAGMDALVAALAAAARGRAARPRRRLPFRLPIDRAFALKGFGAVVTGTLIDGEIGAETEIEILPERLSARVRSVEVHAARRERAEAGERTSLNLAGVDLAQLYRGQIVAAPGIYTPSSILTVDLTALAGLAKPLPDQLGVRVYHFASEVLGHLHLEGHAALASGERAFAQLRLESPLAACAGDRFILRRVSPLETLGGGFVVDPLRPKWKNAGNAGGEALRTLAAAGTADRVVLFAEQAAAGGLARDTLEQRCGCSSAELEDALTCLERDGKLVALPGSPRRWLAATVLAPLRRAARALLGEHARADALNLGMPRGTFAQRLEPRGCGASIGDRLTGFLAAAGEIRAEQDRVFLPESGAGPVAEQGALAERVAVYYRERGLDPPSLGELADALSHKGKILEGLVFYLTKRGDLAKLPGGAILHRDTVAKIATALRARGGEFDIATFKDLFGLTRKLAIPLLEHLDETRVTLRVGDKRRVLPIPL